MGVMTTRDDPPCQKPYDPGLTLQELTNPDRVQVSDSEGVLATLTLGAKTVVVRGPTRTFTEQKRVGAVYKDEFSRTITNTLGLSPFYGSWGTPTGGATTDYTCDGSTGRIEVRAIVKTCGSRSLSCFRPGVLAGPFDQFAVDEGRPGADQGDEVGGVDGPPAVLR